MICVFLYLLFGQRELIWWCKLLFLGLTADFSSINHRMILYILASSLYSVLVCILSASVFNHCSLESELKSSPYHHLDPLPLSMHMTLNSLSRMSSVIHARDIPNGISLILPSIVLRNDNFILYFDVCCANLRSLR